jgi:hypothetical protein
MDPQRGRTSFYQFGGDKPGKSDANVVRTDRELPEVVTTDRESRRRPVTATALTRVWRADLQQPLT